jgi:hypothetical protein
MTTEPVGEPTPVTGDDDPVVASKDEPTKPTPDIRKTGEGGEGAGEGTGEGDEGTGEGTGEGDEGTGEGDEGTGEGDEGTDEGDEGTDEGDEGTDEGDEGTTEGEGQAAHPVGDPTPTIVDDGTGPVGSIGNPDIGSGVIVEQTEDGVVFLPNFTAGFNAVQLWENSDGTFRVEGTHTSHV